MVVSGWRPERSWTVTSGGRGQRRRTSCALLTECGHVHGVGSDHRLCPVRASWQRPGLSHLATSSRLLPRVRELGKLGVPAGVYGLPTAHAEVWSAVRSFPNDNKETRIFSLYAVVDSSAPSDRKIEPLMAATAKTTNARMGKAP
jgi:hypothetical protein